MNLLSEMKIYPRAWQNDLRMDEETYLNLLSLVSLLIQKQDTIINGRQLVQACKILGTHVPFCKHKRV
ncbi:unnamed protein product [Acanthoscelides obtectus]|uniref:Uncharacterized protein n=1 Tax=Acanthoscelides obtectus TaxID=200917 RepID=A0A9P0JWS4_ACAOB|nr:unnamed protein product [Acanthoscelides obtectus]CAK1657085.1 hypothetical protein AOBTE_LOCUS20113 [Acanthoscelides obtectus]